MAENNFILNVIAKLNKSKSNKQVREDIKNLGDFKLPLTGTLNKTKTKAQLKQDLASLNGTVNLTGKVDSKDIIRSVQQVTAQAQKQFDSKPIDVGFNVKKEKLVNDIRLLAKQNSRLFKDTDMSIKYNSLLDDAEMAKNSVELSNLRTQLGAFRSELRVTGNSGLTMTDALKSGLSKVLQLFGSHGIIVQFTAQLRKAWTEAEELDKSMTDLSRVNAEITRSGFPEYLDRVIDKTKQLAVATKDYIDAVTTFSRAGYNLTDSEILADMAVQLEKVGDMSAADASKSLLSGLQAYAEIDGYGMDQLAEKAQALNDKIDIIGNTASITQAEVAEGIQAVGSVMSDANTSVDEFLALLGAANRSVQDANKVALAIRTSALRIRGCTVELQEMGEETDNVIESTSTLAEKIKALTNIDGSGGVNILEADEETFRSIYDIYNDIAKVYNKMSDTDASALLDLIAGKNRSNQISAVLQNMSEANELLERSLNATGTASAEYEIYLQSAQAATERFGVAMTETYSDIISGDTVKGLANAGAAVLNFANSWGILEGTLKGLLGLGILKGITTLTVAFKNSALQVSNYGNALNAMKSINIYAQGTQKYAEAMKTLKSSCTNLTDAQLKQVLANRNLSDSQLVEILQLEKLEVEEQKARLAQLGLTRATEEQIASTFSLKAAMKGLRTSIKNASATSKLNIAFMAISTIISITTSAISKYNQKLEETRRKNMEAATTAHEKAEKLRELYAEYTRLASIQNRTETEEESFKTAVENITVALGNKAKALEGLTTDTDEYAKALANATKEELQSQAVTATVGRVSAEEELQNAVWDDWKGSKVSIDSNDKGKALSDEAQRAVDIVSDALKEFETVNRTWNNISWDISTGDDPVKAFEFYNALIKAREELVLAAENDETLFDTEIYSDLNSAIETMSESLDTYIEQLYEEEKLNYMAQNGIPTTTEEYQNMEDALMGAAGSSADLQEKFKELLTTDFTSLAVSVENVGKVTADTVQTFSTQLTASQESLDKFQSSVKSASDAYATLLSGNYSSSELLDSIQTINQAIKDMGGKINWEFINNQTQIDSLELLGMAIESVSKTYAESILSDAGIDADSEFGQMLANIIQETFEAKAQFTEMNAQLDNLQSSYQTLTGILESYNETGYISLDNLQSLLTADENLIAMLEVENGQLAINQEAYENLVAVQLMEFKEKLNNAAAAEIEALAKSKAEEATNKNADASNNAVEKLDAETAAINRNTIAATSNALAKAEESGVSEDEIQTILDKYNEIWNAAVNNFDGDFDSFMGGTRSASSAGSSAGDAYVDAFEEELKALDELRDNGLISEKEYLDRLRVLYERYFKDKLGYEKEFAKYQKQYLDGYKSLYESVFSHAAKLIGDRIDLIEDEKDKAIDALEAQKKAAEDSYNAQIKLLEDKKDALQDEIDKIKEANEDRKEAINLQEKERELARAENQKTILQYTADRGFIYTTDDEAIRDAKDELDSTKADAEIRELEKKQDALDKQIDDIQEKLDASNEYWDAQIEQAENYYDTMIKGLEEYKSRWEELSGLQEHAEMIALLKELGLTEEDLLNESSGAFDRLRTSYLGILKDLNTGNKGVLDGLSKLADIDMSNIPSFLSEMQGYIDSISGMDVTALSDGLNDVSDGFSNIADSASSAASAISGGGASAAKPNGNTSEDGSQKNTGNTGNGSSLTEAIGKLAQDGVQEITKISDAFAGEDGEGTSVTGAIQKVIDKVGNADAESGDSESLMSTLSEQTTQALDEENGIPAQKTAWEEMNTPLNDAVDSITTLQSTLEDMDGKEFTVTLNMIGNAASLGTELLSKFATSGNAKVEGTANIKGTANAQGNWGIKESGRTLVGELGQEIWVHSKDGTFETVGDNGAEFINPEKGDIIFNHLQTRQLLDKGNIIGRGKAYAEGSALVNGSTDPTMVQPERPYIALEQERWEKCMAEIERSVNTIEDTIVTADGQVLRPIREGDRAWELQKAFAPLVARIQQGEDFISNAYFEHQKQYEKWTKEITNNTAMNNISNNRNSQVINQEIHVTLPNVTNSTSADELLKDLKTLGYKKYEFV